jgi:hypothetical protein
MTSQINFAAISTTYPVAGQDNDSQGFRDNFTAIQNGLATAKTEITTMQSNVLLAADLAASQPVDNNMLGSTLHNGLYYQFNGVFFNGGTVSTSTNVSLNNGPVQKFTMGGNAVLTFTNWPTTNKYSVIRLVLLGGITTYTATLATSNAGVFKLDRTWGSTLLANDATSYIFGGTVSGGTTCGGTASAPTVKLLANSKVQVIEAWTVDAGTTVYLKNIGEW